MNLVITNRLLTLIEGEEGRGAQKRGVLVIDGVRSLLGAVERLKLVLTIYIHEVILPVKLLLTVFEADQMDVVEDIAAVVRDQLDLILGLRLVLASPLGDDVLVHCAPQLLGVQLDVGLVLVPRVHLILLHLRQLVRFLEILVVFALGFLAPESSGKE